MDDYRFWSCVIASQYHLGFVNINLVSPVECPLCLKLGRENNYEGKCRENFIVLDILFSYFVFPCFSNQTIKEILLNFPFFFPFSKLQIKQNPSCFFLACVYKGLVRFIQNIFTRFYFFLACGFKGLALWSMDTPKIVEYVYRILIHIGCIGYSK